MGGFAFPMPGPGFNALLNQAYAEMQNMSGRNQEGFELYKRRQAMDEDAQRQQMAGNDEDRKFMREDRRTSQRERGDQKRRQKLADNDAAYETNSRRGMMGPRPKTGGAGHAYSEQAGDANWNDMLMRRNHPEMLPDAAVLGQSGAPGMQTGISQTGYSPQERFNAGAPGGAPGGAWTPELQQMYQSLLQGGASPRIQQGYR
jgi:hypothetical protein